jgi:hypothetical protein
MCLTRKRGKGLACVLQVGHGRSLAWPALRAAALIPRSGRVRLCAFPGEALRTSKGNIKLNDHCRKCPNKACSIG